MGKTFQRLAERGADFVRALTPKTKKSYESVAPEKDVALRGNEAKLRNYAVNELGMPPILATGDDAVAHAKAWTHGNDEARHELVKLAMARNAELNGGAKQSLESKKA